MTTAPVVEPATAGLIEAGGLVAAPEQGKRDVVGLIGAQDAEQQESASRTLQPGRRRRPPPSSRRGGRESPQTAAANRRENCRRQWNPNGFQCRSGLDHIGRRYDPSHSLLAVELGAAGSIQDAAHLVLSAGADDPRQCWVDRIRVAHAIRGGGNPAIRRIHPGGVYRFIAYWREGKSSGKDPGQAVWSTTKSWGVIVKESGFLTARRVRWCAGCL